MTTLPRDHPAQRLARKLAPGEHELDNERLRTVFELPDGTQEDRAQIVEDLRACGLTILKDPPDGPLVVFKPRPWWRLGGSINAIIIRAGALAAAISAIFALILVLLPNPPNPDPVDSARFLKVGVRSGVALSEYRARTDYARVAQHSLPERAVRLAGVTDALAQVGAQTDPTPTTTTQTTPTTTTPTTTTQTTPTTTTPTTTTQTTPTTTTTQTTPTTPEPQPTPRLGNVLDRELPVLLPKDATRSEFGESADRVIQKVEVEVGTDLSCEREVEPGVCGAMAPMLAAASTDADGEQVSQAVAATRLVALLRNVRTTNAAKNEPIGALVSFAAELTGLRGNSVLVGWSIWDAGSEHRLFGRWLATNLAYRLKASSEKDVASLDIWVPLPKDEGPFFVRLTLTADGTRLAHIDTDEFR